MSVGGAPLGAPLVVGGAEAGGEQGRAMDFGIGFGVQVITLGKLRYALLSTTYFKIRLTHHKVIAIKQKA